MKLRGWMGRPVVLTLLCVASGMLAMAPALPVLAHTVIHLVESSHAHAHGGDEGAHHHGHSHDASEDDGHSLPEAPSLDALRGATGRIDPGGSASEMATAWAGCGDLARFAVAVRSTIIQGNFRRSSPRSSPSRPRAPPFAFPV